MTCRICQKLKYSTALWLVMGNCCDMRGFLTFTVLRLMVKKPLSGGDLRRELEKRKGSKPSPGTIYPVLKALSGNGLIEEVKGTKASKEKLYRITRTGKGELAVATEKFVAMFCDMKDEFGKTRENPK